jgi:hypothetical protein
MGPRIRVGCSPDVLWVSHKVSANVYNRPIRTAVGSVSESVPLTRLPKNRWGMLPFALYLA